MLLLDSTWTDRTPALRTMAYPFIPFRYAALCGRLPCFLLKLRIGPKHDSVIQALLISGVSDLFVVLEDPAYCREGNTLSILHFPEPMEGETPHLEHVAALRVYLADGREVVCYEDFEGLEHYLFPEDTGLLCRDGTVGEYLFATGKAQ